MLVEDTSGRQRSLGLQTGPVLKKKEKKAARHMSNNTPDIWY